MGQMKVGIVRAIPAANPNTNVAVRCPDCDEKRWVVNGKDEGCTCSKKAKAAPKKAAEAKQE